jgi:hypothetical protein
MSTSGTDVAEEHGIRRSPHWPTVEKHFKQQNPFCLACGKDKTLDESDIQVHHRIPFHFCILLGRPDLELDPRNLVGLCETETGRQLPNHHLLLGHLDDFKSYNVSVLVDAEKNYFGMSALQIKASPMWQNTARQKPHAWALMTDDEKKALRKLMDEWYPV